MERKNSYAAVEVSNARIVDPTRADSRFVVLWLVIQIDSKNGALRERIECCLTCRIRQACYDVARSFCGCHE
jgi:hypothetical protein